MGESSLPYPLFYCYARKDRALRDELDAHFAGLKHSKHIVTWYDGEIAPGAEWKKDIEEHLNAATLILLLISPDFLNSDYCYGKELRNAMKRHNEGKALVIPILLRPVDWAETPFSHLQMLPSNGKPVMSSGWFNSDEAFENVARGIRYTIDAIARQRDVKNRYSLDGDISRYRFSAYQSSTPPVLEYEDDASYYTSSSYEPSVYLTEPSVSPTFEEEDVSCYESSTYESSMVEEDGNRNTHAVNIDDDLVEAMTNLINKTSPIFSILPVSKEEVKVISWLADKFGF